MSASDRAVWPQEMPLCHPLFHFPFCMGTLVGYRLLLWEWKQSNGFNYLQCSLLIFSFTHTSSRAHSKVQLSGHDDRREIRHIHTSPKPIISWFLFQSQLLVQRSPESWALIHPLTEYLYFVPKWQPHPRFISWSSMAATQKAKKEKHSHPDIHPDKKNTWLCSISHCILWVSFCSDDA